MPTRFGQLELYYLVPLTTGRTPPPPTPGPPSWPPGWPWWSCSALLAALVTRLVVTPVRVAARTAQRLSAGLLDQRMEVNGEDDLALLAASFNQMAANLQRQIVRLEEMSRLQRRFTSDVSHELRTPLTTVRMAADLIFAERDEFDPAVARSAELLQAELDRFEEPAHRPAGDQPLRRRLRRARRRADRPGAGGAPGRRPARRRWPSGSA